MYYGKSYARFKQVNPGIHSKIKNLKTSKALLIIYYFSLKIYITYNRYY